MQVDVLDKSGKKTDRKVDLNDDIFGIQPHEHLLYMDVKRHRNARRQGTHKAKERGELTGSTAKIKRQKGTGSARSGDIKSPIFRGGGTVFGPRPRNYNIKLNKKERDKAKRSALSQKAREERVRVLEDLQFDRPATKEFAGVLKNLSVEDQKVLVVLPDKDRNLGLSARNIPNASVVPYHELNTYDVLKARHLIFLESAIDKIESLHKKA